MGKKIGFIQDFNIFAYPGGAEMNDTAHFKEGLRRGYDMSLINPDTAFSEQSCLIISNCVSFDRHRLRDMVKGTKKVVWFFHDYIFCKYRLFYPAAGQCLSCGNIDYWRDLFSTASLFIWLSPLHRDMTLFALPELKNKPYALIPSAVDPDRFIVDENKPVDPRKKAYLSVNTLYEFKGKANILRWAADNPDKELHILSAAECFEQFPGNVTVLPPATYDQMPEIYRDYENYLELPSRAAPYNRTVVEARLSGCKIHTNKLMGAASWDWFDKDLSVIAERLKAAPGEFWQSIEKIL